MLTPQGYKNRLIEKHPGVLIDAINLILSR